MAQVSSLKGSERQNHKYISREWKNGKWKYVYKTDEDSGSSGKNQNEVSNSGPTVRASSGKTSDWAKAWLDNKNKKSTAVKTTVAQAVKSGKSAASRLVKTNNPVYRAKTTTSPQYTNEEYKQKLDELNTEAKSKMEQNEQQYKVAYEKEKEAYKEKLVTSLNSKYGDSIPEEELTKIESKVNEYAETLWKDVYEPQVKRINTAIEEANKSITRALKKKYSDVDLTHSELYHHGIKGQKWGERNGPPYPLGQNQKSSAEKKNGISPNTKKWIKIGLAIVGTGMAVWGLYKLGALDSLIKKGKHVTLSYNDLMKASMKQFYAPPLHYDINRIGQKIKELEAAAPKKSAYKWENKDSKKVLDDDSILRIDEIMDKSRDEVLRDYGRWPLGYEESGRVLHNLNRNNLTEFERSLRFFYKPIGDYIYLVMNNFNDTYDIIDRVKIPNSDTGLTERDFK